MILVEFAFSLFDAVLCVYFITKFNGASVSPKKNKLFPVAILVIFLFSMVNDLCLEGFNVVGTIIFLALYIAYSLLIANKKYVRAVFSACLFEIIFILLSSILYLIISSIINDYDSLSQGATSIFRYIYIIMHKIILFVILKLVLWSFSSGEGIDAKHGIIAFLFSFTTVLGLGSTMYLASIARSEAIQLQSMIITLAFAFANFALYFLIFQMQKYQQNKYELKMLRERIAFEQSRHNDASAIWSNVKHLQHDMKQHLSVISGYLEANNTEDCKKYVRELSLSTNGVGSIICSGNSVLDYLINSKLTPLKDTKVVISGSIGDLSDIKETDLTCLVGNILDNAIEALERIRKVNEKRIELLFMRQNSNRIIICKNTIEGSVLENNHELETTKECSDAHGYGTKIIAKIVSDYNGMVDYFEEFNMFGIQIILPEP